VTNDEHVIMRTFHVTVDVRQSVKEPPAPRRFAIELRIDAAGLAQSLGARAVRAKHQRATLGNGLVRAVSLGEVGGAA
jgi:hypothetical protein